MAGPPARCWCRTCRCRTSSSLWRENENLWRRTIASVVNKEIRVYTWAGEGTTNISPRKNESEEAFAKRQAKHHYEMMKDRVIMVGHDGTDWPSS